MSEERATLLLSAYGFGMLVKQKLQCATFKIINGTSDNICKMRQPVDIIAYFAGKSKKYRCYMYPNNNEMLGLGLIINPI